MRSNYFIRTYFLVLVYILNSSSGSVVLRTCDGRKTEVTIPNIFMSTNQTMTFETSHEELKCQSGMDEIKSSTEYPILIRPSGYVSILSSELEGIFYSKDQYCIHRVSEAELQIQTCKRVCTEREPCINKCCPPDEIFKLAFTDDDFEWCTNPGKEKYTPRIYKSSSEAIIKNEVNPWYSWYPLDVWIYKCPDEGYHIHPFGQAVANAIDEKHRRKFQIRADGRKALWNSKARHWEYMEPTENYCVDGIIYKPDQTYENKEGESVLMACRRGDALKNEKKLDLSNYYGILYVSNSWFALITLLIYALLWEKQNIHGWTIMSHCVAVFFWFIFSGIAHLTKTDFEQTIFCTFSATMFHFFVIATFCWLTLISFDLWNTFMSMRVPKGKGVKKFICYSLFGWGIPLFMVCFSWSMEFMYSADDESEVSIPRYGIEICYISQYALGLYVYLPFGILMLANIILFSITTWKLIQIKRKVRFATENIKKDQQSYSLFFKLFFVTGSLWIFDIISWLVDKDHVHWYWTVLDSLNLISPFCIFVIFICKRDIIKSLDSKYPCLKCVLSPILRFIDRNKRRSSQFGMRSQIISTPSNIEMQNI